MQEGSIIIFPCEFPIKIIGKNTELLISNIIKIVQKHYPDFNVEKLTFKKSSLKNYIAITITVTAADKVTLDALYNDLNQLTDILMVL